MTKKVLGRTKHWSRSLLFQHCATHLVENKIVGGYGGQNNLSDKMGFSHWQTNMEHL